MEAPKPQLTIINKEKDYIMFSNNKKKFSVKLINNITSLCIFANSKENFIEHKYENIFSMNNLKKHKIFYFHDSIDEILEELIPIIDNKKYIIQEENNKLIITFNFPLKKVNEVKFVLLKKEKNEKEKEIEFHSIINNHQNEIESFKNYMTKLSDENLTEIKLLKEDYEIKNKQFDEKLTEIKKLKEDYEIKNKQIDEKLTKIKLLKEDYELKNKQFDEIIKEKNGFFFISKIIINSFDIKFIEDAIKKNKNLNHNKIFYKLIFRASDDGETSIDFHNKCDNIPNQLIILETSKGIIFGGYTKIGFKNSKEGLFEIDNDAFIFSYNKKKIYFTKKNKEVIYNNNIYGPCFESGSDSIILIKENMLTDECSTCTAEESFYDDLNSDYEINNGNEYFYLKEIEVFQVTII